MSRCQNCINLGCNISSEGGREEATPYLYRSSRKCLQSGKRPILPKIDNRRDHLRIYLKKMGLAWACLLLDQNLNYMNTYKLGNVILLMKTKQQLWSTKSPIWALWWDPPPTSKVWGCLVVLRLSACPTLAWRLNRNIIKYVIIILESIFVYLSRRLQKGIWNKISFKKHNYKILKVL